MKRMQQGLARASRGFNAIAALAIIGMMALTCADVLLRLLRRPIPGTFEIVGFLGTVVISFSLAYTSIERGHIAVEFIVARLSRRLQAALEAVTSLASAALFALLAWQSWIYASDIRQSGEVSVTLTMPIHPFIYGIAAGSGLLVLVLLGDSLQAARRAVKP